MQEKAVDLGRIQLSDTCRHKILPRDCARCSIECLLLYQNRNPHLLNRDILRNVIYPLVKGNRASYFLDCFYASTHCIKFNDGSKTYNKYDGLVLVEDPARSLESVGRMRIVFLGSEEAYLGFLCCLVMKYGQTTMLHYELESYIAENLLIKFRERYHPDHDSSNIFFCLFQKYPQATAYMRVYYNNSRTHWRYFWMENPDEFLSGYRAMLEINVEKVTSRNDMSNDPVVVYKEARHEMNCPHCLKDGDQLLDIPDLIESSHLYDIPVKGNCKAYWYYV